MIDYYDVPFPRKKLYHVEAKCDGHTHIRVDMPARMIVLDAVSHGILVGLLRMANDDQSAGDAFAERISKMREGDCVQIAASYGDDN